MNWVVRFAVLRGGERSAEDGSPRYIAEQPFPVPDIDQTVLHRGEAFVVDDVIWDLERHTITVELSPLVEDAVAEGRDNSAEDEAEEAEDETEDEGDAEGGDEN